VLAPRLYRTRCVVENLDTQHSNRLLDGIVDGMKNDSRKGAEAQTEPMQCHSAVNTSYRYCHNRHSVEPAAAAGYL